jgi:hypothetical protein
MRVQVREHMLTEEQRAKRAEVAESVDMVAGLLGDLAKTPLGRFTLDKLTKPALQRVV